MDIQFFTLAPSPHLVGVLDELYRRPSANLQVVYERKWLDERSWGLHSGEAPHVYLGSWDVTGYGQHVSLRLRSEMQGAAPDVAVVNTSYVSLNTYALICLLSRRDIPFVFWAERVSRLSYSLVKWIRRPFLKWILGRAAGFVGPTEATVQFYRSSFSYEGPATWVPYHRDLTPFLELSSATNPDGRVCFLVLGSLTHGKGIDTVVRALANVERPSEVLIAGDGPKREALERMAETRCTHHRIRFLGRVPYDRVPELMQEAEVLLFPSRHDGFGMVTMEALAAGRPVVASRAVMAARQYVRPGANGWLLPAEDASAWSEQIEAILDAREQLPQWGQAARDTIRSRYCVKEDVSRLLRFLDNFSSVQTSVPAADLPG